MKFSYFEHHIFCCINRRDPGHTRGCCAEKGSEMVREHIKRRVKQLKIPRTRVNAAGCLDRCELGPCIVIYPEGIWYRCGTLEDAEEIIREHLQQGRIVERLRLPPS